MALAGRRERAEPSGPASAPQHGWRRWLADGLFPSAGPTRPTARTVLGVVAAVAVGVWLLLLRQSGMSPLDTVWAEDGRVYLTQALQVPLGQALLLPAGGYLQTYPRLAGAVAAQLPLRLASDTLTMAAAAAAASLSVLIYIATAGHIRSRAIRAALAAATLLAPVAGNEMLNNVANVQWYLVFAAYWGLLWRPQRLPALAAGSGVLVLAATSAPVSALLAPVAALRLVVVGSWRDRVLPLAFAAGLAAQLGRIATSPNPGDVGAEPGQIAAGFMLRVAAEALAGHALSARLWIMAGWVLPVLATAVVLGAFAYAAVRRDLRCRPAVLLAGIMALVVFAATTYLRGSDASLVWPAGSSHMLSGRYAFVPVGLVLSMLAMLLDARPPQLSASAWRHWQVGALAMLCFVVGQNFFVVNARSEGPSWSAELAEARASCPTDPDGTVAVPISPPPGWFAYLPCEHVVGSGDAPGLGDPRRPPRR